MKLLLSSAGATNPTIRAALDSLLPRPVADCDALCISTASYANGPRGAQQAWTFVSGNATGTPMVELGWRSMGLLELSVLPSIGRAMWEPWVRAADVILVNGGDPMFLAHWIVESGLAEVLPTLGDGTVWFGLSAGSMVMAPRIGEDFVRWRSPSGDDTTLGIVDFAIFPHVGHPSLPENTVEAAELWAAGLGIPAYAIDDATAIIVDGERVEVVSEGRWHRFEA